MLFERFSISFDRMFGIRQKQRKNAIIVQADDESSHSLLNGRTSQKTDMNRWSSLKQRKQTKEHISTLILSKASSCSGLTEESTFEESHCEDDRLYANMSPIQRHRSRSSTVNSTNNCSDLMDDISSKGSASSRNKAGDRKYKRSRSSSTNSKRRQLKDERGYEFEERITSLKSLIPEHAINKSLLDISEDEDSLSSSTSAGVRQPQSSFPPEIQRSFNVTRMEDDETVTNAKLYYSWEEKEIYEDKEGTEIRQSNKSLEESLSVFGHLQPSEVVRSSPIKCSTQVHAHQESPSMSTSYYFCDISSPLQALKGMKEQVMACLTPKRSSVSKRRKPQISQSTDEFDLNHKKSDGIFKSLQGKIDSVFERDKEGRTMRNVSLFDDLETDSVPTIPSSNITHE